MRHAGTGSYDDGMKFECADDLMDQTWLVKLTYSSKLATSCMAVLQTNWFSFITLEC